MLICACEEHLERALDNFIEEKHEPPDMYLWQQLKDEGFVLEEQCRYCKEKALYVVKGYAD